MSIPIQTTFAQPDPALKFTTLTALIQILNQLVQSQAPEDVTPYIIGSAVPDVDDQDKVWIRKTTLGAPAGTYVFHSGVWVREQPSPSGLIGPFSGNPTLYFGGNGKGLKGPGPIAGDYWGWALMDGQDGRANLSDRFIVGGRMDNVGITGFSGGAWRSNVTGTPLQTGGAAEVTLDADTSFSSDLTVGLHDATGETLDDAGKLYGKVGDGSSNLDVITGNDSPDPIKIVPPFFALAWIQFIGYT
jgi:hypothetical protein